MNNYCTEAGVGGEAFASFEGSRGAAGGGAGGHEKEAARPDFSCNSSQPAGYSGDLATPAGPGAAC